MPKPLPMATLGRELPEFTWERTDKAAALKAAAGI